MDSQRPLLERLYQQYLASEKSADFVRAVADAYSIPTLHALAARGRYITRRAAILAISFLSDYRSSDILGRALQDSDRAVRLLADHGIRHLWFRLPDPWQHASLRRIPWLIYRNRFTKAVDAASELVERAPRVSEAWNQRAIGLYALGDYSHAVCDCRQALDHNRYHFLAALCMADCHMQLDDASQALESLRTALSINPDLERVRSQIRRLERIVEGR